MATGSPYRLAIGGVEIALDTSAPLLSALLERFRGYESCDERPALKLHFSPVANFAPPRPLGRAYPELNCVGLSDTHYELWRSDCHGHLEVPLSPDEPVVATFSGNAHRAALEAALRACLASTLPRVGGLLLHSSGVTHDGQAFVFSGPSGAGKTTVARLLRDAVPTACPLGDDLTILRRDSDGGIRAHATPFAGELEPAPRHHAPIAGVHFLVHSSRHARRALPSRELLLRSILRNTLVYVAERAAAARVLDAGAALAQQLEGYVLEFSKTPGVARVLGIA